MSPTATQTRAGHGTEAVMEAAPPDRGGIASGVINAARQAGGVLTATGVPRHRDDGG